MVERPEEADGRRGGLPDDEGLTPARSRDGTEDTLPAEPVAAPGRSQGRTPGVDVDVERAAARARLKANLFQIESEPLRVGRFTILSRLGQGGMGVVYSAYDEDLDRKVAVKVMLPDFGSDTARDRMRREAQAMARLAHPNIVTVHEVGSLGEQVYIAMEFVRGGSLEQWLDEQERSWSEVLGVFDLAGRGLQAAHEAGLVHRDFKPQNVMVGEDGSVKVLDFGLARDERSFAPRSDDEAAEPEPEGEGGLLDRAITRTGALVGTPAYMSPEQHEGGPVTAHSDQFSFAVALYKGLYGVHPFEGETLGALVASVCEGVIRTPDDEGRVPAWVRAVVRRGLAVDPQQRYPSMAAMLDALTHDPRARSRRRLGLGAAVLAVFAGGYAVAQVDGGPKECPGVEQMLAGLWGEQRRARVEAGVEACGSAQAGPTWERLGPALDGYAGAWAEAREVACHDGREGRSSESLHERRTLCLDRSQAAFDTLAELLEHPDAGAVDKAVEATANLPPLSQCEDAEALLADVVPPPEAIAQPVAEFRRTLERARVLDDLGRVQEGLDLAARVQQESASLDYPPLHAEARLRRGVGQMTRRDADAAGGELSEALWLALEVGHDRAAAEAAVRRVWVRSELQGDTEGAFGDLPLAGSLVGRVGDDRLRSVLLNNEGLLQLRRGELAEAERLLGEALQLKREVFGATHLEVAFSSVNLGLVLRRAGRPSEAYRHMQTADEIFAEALGPWHPHRGRLLPLLSSVLIELGRLDEAEAVVERGEQFGRRNPGVDEGLGVSTQIRRAKLALRRRHWAEARAIHEALVERIEASHGTGHPTLVNARLGLIGALLHEGQRERAEQLISRSFSGLGTGREARILAAGARTAIGVYQVQVGLYAEARQTLHQAQVASAEFEDPIGDAYRRSWLGRSWLAEGDHERADPLVRTAAQELLALESMESPRVHEALGALGQLEWAQGRAEASAEVFEKLAAEFGRHRPDDDPSVAWVRAQRARARAAASPGSADAERTVLTAAHAVLAASPGWAHEAAQARAWLDAPSP